MFELKNVKYVLFDLDGTISDSSEGITKSAKVALEKEGFFETQENLLRFIGPSLRVSFAKYTSDENQRERMLKNYRERYKERGWKENVLYDGVKELLENLKKQGKSPVLASAKPEYFCIQILKYFGIYDLFDFVGGSDFDGKRDDKKVLMGYVLANIDNPSPDEVIMIGDRMYDVECAHFYDIKCIGVKYGFAPKGELESAGADYIVENVQELSRLLMK